MLIWIILFFIITIVSFILALKSMGDYRAQPLTIELKYSLFLIQKPHELSLEVLKKIHEEASNGNTIISIEKLFKGEKTALVIFAPKEMANKFPTILDLLELEDYSSKEISNFKTWEMGSKNLSPKLLEKDFLIELPHLKTVEELWWQIILKPQAGSYQCREKDLYFQSIIRVVLLTTDKTREQEISELLLTQGKELGFNLLPQAYSGPEILGFYRERVLPLDYNKDLGEGALPFLIDEQVMALLKIQSN